MGETAIVAAWRRDTGREGRCRRIGRRPAAPPRPQGTERATPDPRSATLKRRAQVKRSQAMQQVVTQSRESIGHTYAEPLSGLRVSWGAILAGTVALFAVSLILWALALAIVALVAHPAAGSLKGSAIALWICGMVTTLVGAFVGGYVAGYVPGNAGRGIARAHGFLAWGLALVVSFAFQLVVLRGAVVTAASALADAAAVESTGAGTGFGEGMSPMPGEPGAQPSMRGPMIAPAPSRADIVYAGKVALDYIRGAGWSWFGTWFLAGLSALAGASLAARRLAGPREPLEARETPPREAPPVSTPTPLTPAPTA
jgi:hypothetical protein